MGLFKRDIAKSLDLFIEQTQVYRTSWASRSLRTEPWPRDSFRLPSWQAHRGFWTDGAPQNTLESLIRARELSAPMAEFDVRLTRDRVVVLFHDESIPGAEGENLKLAVRDLTFAELRERTQEKMNLCTLREVLESSLVPDNLNIELKSEEIWNDPLERYVAEEVSRAEAQKRVLFSSFNPISLWKIANYLPEVPRALLVSPDMEQRSLREMWWAPFLKIHLLHLDKTMVDEVSLNHWQRRHVPIAVWTATSSDEMAHFLKIGAVSVISDCLPRPSEPAREYPKAP